MDVNVSLQDGADALDFVAETFYIFFDFGQDVLFDGTDMVVVHPIDDQSQEGGAVDETEVVHRVLELFQLAGRDIKAGIGVLAFGIVVQPVKGICKSSEIFVMHQLVEQHIDEFD